MATGSGVLSGCCGGQEGQEPRDLANDPTQPHDQCPQRVFVLNCCRYLVRVAGIRRMNPRDPADLWRSSSPLELFFDLVFVVAVSIASAELGQQFVANQIGAGTLGFATVFFAIWWAWVNFTWFASAFDVDDWVYRLLTLTQMLGVVVLALGVRAAMTNADFGWIIVGYVIMRATMVIQWLRAAASSPKIRGTALRFALGISVAQLGWVGFGFLGHSSRLWVFVILVVVELLVPVWAEFRHPTPWHPGHIADRYGSFTMIVLGESVLAAITAIVASAGPNGISLSTAGIGLGAFLIVAGMWWIYFSRPVEGRLGTLGSALWFGFGHYLVFASAAAFSAGVAVLVAESSRVGSPGSALAQATLTVPVGLFVLAVWAVVLRYRMRPWENGAVILGAVLLAGCAMLANPILWMVLVMGGLVGLVEGNRGTHPTEAAPA